MKKKVNFLFIMSDDHASHAISWYGSKINKTPNIDRIGKEGIRFDNCFCTNSLCSPSRASILTGTYSHINGVYTLAPSTCLDNRILTFPKILQKNGYQTAIFGKWHLGTGPKYCPSGFYQWAVLPGQGYYNNPEFIFKGPNGGKRKTVKGYVTDLITDMCIEYLESIDKNKPFCLFCHHKAPHRHWEPDEKHMKMFLNEEIPEPETLYDDYSNRSTAAKVAEMRVGVHMNEKDLKCEINRNLSENELRKWAYQRYIKDYLRCIASIDDNVGRLLDYLDKNGLRENTVVFYTSDQGFFLGDHGWFDKRFMYEESLKMPLLIRYPEKVKPKSINKDIVLNVDFASTFLELAGLPVPETFQGRSFLPLLEGKTPSDWRKEMYYRYWTHRGGHNVFAHYGIRNRRYKLIYYYADGLNFPWNSKEKDKEEWELFDLEKDPFELNNVYYDSKYSEVVNDLKQKMEDIQKEIGETPYNRGG